MTQCSTKWKSGTNCSRQAMPGRLRCEKCNTTSASTRTQRRAIGLCGCGAEKETGKYRCKACSKKLAERSAMKRADALYQFIANLSSTTSWLARGKCLTSCQIDWTHEEFIAKHGAVGDKVVDHIIPLRAICDPADESFILLVTGLENLQLIPQADNAAKGVGIDKRIVSLAKKLHAEGVNGSALFEALKEEYSTCRS